MADAQLYEKAATCYLQARLVADAVRCYRRAGAHRRAADLNASLGEYREAALDYERCGLPELAAWLLVHQVRDPAAARAVLTRLAPVASPFSYRARRAAQPLSLRQRLVLARCAIAEGAPPSSILPVIDDTCAELAEPTVPYDRLTEEWAVAVAGLAQRYDQVALIFAASVRGLRRGAAQRWSDWSGQALGAPLAVSTVPPPARLSAAG
jgi:hypothetical protein